MNTLNHQLNLLRRRQEADDDARRDRRDQLLPLRGGALRRGVCKIVSNDDDGEYTVTELWWNPDTDQWDCAVKPLGYVSRAARDYLGRDEGEADGTVTFWEQQAKGGNVEVLIDAGAAITGGDGASLALSGWVDVDGEGTKTVTLDSNDWRSRVITHDIGWDSEPMLGDSFGNTESGVQVPLTATSNEVNVFSKMVGNDSVRMYVDGAAGGILKLEIGKGNPQSYMHLFYWVTASPYHPDPTT